MTLVICIVSRGRNSGKTSLIECITRMLSRKGVNIATVKNIHHSFDTSDKDTWRHLEAGAKVTVATTPNELVIIKRKVTPSLNDALASINVQTDLVLVEGFKRSTYPKILCVPNSSEAIDAVNEISNIILVTGTIIKKQRISRR